MTERHTTGSSTEITKRRPRRTVRGLASVGATAALVGSLLVAGASPAMAGACEAGWMFSAESRGADVHEAVAVTQSNYNGSGADSTMTFSAEASGTVEATVSGSTNVSVDAKVASVSATYGISATASVTAGLGNTIEITVPNGATGNASYGVWRAYTTGTERYYTPACDVTAERQTTVYAPYQVGWNTWVS